MKNRKALKRHELKKEREFRNMVIVTFVVIAAIIGLYWLINKPVRVAASMDQDIVSYIHSKVSEQQVCPGREPVALYYRHPGMVLDEFCCIGTIYQDKNHGTVVMTAEHVFRSDIRVPQIITILPLRKSVKAPPYYLSDIILTSSQLDGQDAVVGKLGTNPVLFAPFSHFVYDETGKNYYGLVRMGKTLIPELKSVLSGEKVRTIGYCQRGHGTNGPFFILIEYRCRPGESGTGFVDDRDGLYVLHTGPQPEIEKAMINECHRLGHVDVSAISTVSGPFGGHYDD